MSEKEENPVVGLDAWFPLYISLASEIWQRIKSIEIPGWGRRMGPGFCDELIALEIDLDELTDPKLSTIMKLLKLWRTEMLKIEFVGIEAKGKR